MANNTFDFAKIIIKRKRLLILIMTLALAAGLFFAFFSKKIYVVDMLVEVGTYPGQEDSIVAIENPHQLTEKIASGSYDYAVKAKLGIPKNNQLDVKAENPDNTNLVRIFIHSARPEADLGVLDEVGALVMADHQERSRVRNLLVSDSLVETVIVKDPTISGKPINDRPLLIVLFALFIGGIISLFAVFATEWWRRSLEE